MEPVTHLLASVALARSGADRITRLAMPLLVVAGLAPDLDVVSIAGGARGYLAYHRTVTHSIPGGIVLAFLLAAIFCRFGRKHPASPLRFGPAFLVAAIGIAGHLLLDLGDSYGIELFWPFRRKWYAWDLWPQLDLVILLLLAAALLLPALFRLVSEEIGARPARRASRGATVAVALLALYGCGRAAMHSRVLDLLDSRMYHGAEPLVVGAFPSTHSPLLWRGVVETDNTIEGLEVSLAPGDRFDPDRSRTHFKPTASPALAAARATETARQWLQFARFPLASVEQIGGRYHVVFRDLRYSSDTDGWLNPVAVVDLDGQLNVTGESMRFGPVAPFQ